MHLGVPYPLSKDEYYLETRNILIDYRGEVYIHPTAEISYNVRIYTAGHPANWLLGKERSPIMLKNKVIIEAHAWICSEVILYNCVIGAGAVVAIGSVVRSMNVESCTMVEGNPARVIARLEDDEWRYLDY